MRSFLVVVVLTVAACSGPTHIVMHNEKTGDVQRCFSPPGGNWNPQAVTESCAKGYEAAGYVRASTY